MTHDHTASTAPTGKVSTMKSYRFAWLFAAAILLCARPAEAQSGITFTLDHLEVTSDGVTFDVLAAADGSRLGDSQVYLAYDVETFGARVAEGGRISAALGDALTGSYGAPIINDNADGRVSVTAPFLGSVDDGVALGSNPVVLLHVTMHPASGGESGSVRFYEPLMDGQQYTADLATAFTGVNADGLLDVGLTGILSLSAVPAGGGAVQLDWTTAGSSAGFEVEHADGAGAAFRPVASIERANEARVAHRVEGLELGTHVFRVRQVDEAGRVTYSESVEVAVEMAEEFLLDPIYPNPFNPQAMIRFAVRKAETVRIELYNALGQRLRVLYDATPAAGQFHEVTLDGSDLAGGAYFVRLEGESFAATQRVLLVK